MAVADPTPPSDTSNSTDVIRSNISYIMDGNKKITFPDVQVFTLIDNSSAVSSSNYPVYSDAIKYFVNGGYPIIRRTGDGNYQLLLSYIQGTYAVFNFITSRYNSAKTYYLVYFDSNYDVTSISTYQTYNVYSGDSKTYGFKYCANTPSSYSNDTIYFVKE